MCWKQQELDYPSIPFVFSPSYNSYLLFLHFALANPWMKNPFGVAAPAPHLQWLTLPSWNKSFFLQQRTFHLAVFHLLVTILFPAAYQSNQAYNSEPGRTGAEQRGPLPLSTVALLY